MSTGPYVLIIDDDEAIQAFISMSLANEGYRVNVASEGLQALDLLTQQSPALILLDIRMPKMDGRAFLHAYRQMPGPHAPVVVMTAGRNTADTTADLDVAGFLAKPFDLNDLLNLIAEYVKS